MTEAKTNNTRQKNLADQLQIIQWALPLFLFIVASGFEIYEHILTEGETITFGFDAFNAEIGIFALLGPISIWWVLGWAAGKQRKLDAAHAKIQRMNSELERRVEERTAELKHKNDALRQAYRELQALDDMKSDFVSLVSHELRTPLTNINGGIELIARERAVLSLQKQEVLDTLQKESLRLTKLVKSILEISLLESGKLDANCGPVSLAPFIKS